MELIDAAGYCEALRCPKMLWLNLKGTGGKRPSLEKGRSDEVFKLALRYFGGPAEVDSGLSLEDQCQRTRELLESGVKVIANGVFKYKSYVCRADVLKKCSGGYELIEVKGSSHIHSSVYEAMAFKRYIMAKSGFYAGRFSVLKINRMYERGKRLSVKGLFLLSECTDEVLGRYKSVTGRLSNIVNTLKQNDEPERKLSQWCVRPDDCMYKAYCHRGIESPSVLDIHGLSVVEKYKLLNRGIVTYSDIIENRIKLSEKCMHQVRSTYYSLPPEIDVERLRAFLSKLWYPLCFLDFECFQQAVPMARGIRPFTPVPFQFSLHIQNRPGTEPVHFEFLAKEGTDPRRELAQRLCSLVPDGACILSYNMALERTMLKYLAEQFPELSPRLCSMHENVFDLMEPFEKGMYYSREMEGSYSLKKVLPAMCGEREGLSYRELDGIHDGGEALEAYLGLNDKTPEEIEVVRAELLRYCELDTLAMVNILERLIALSE